MDEPFFLMAGWSFFHCCGHWIKIVSGSLLWSFWATLMEISLIYNRQKRGREKDWPGPIDQWRSWQPVGAVESAHFLGSWRLFQHIWSLYLIIKRGGFSHQLLSIRRFWHETWGCSPLYKVNVGRWSLVDYTLAMDKCN